MAQPPSTPSKQVKRRYDLKDSPSKPKLKRRRECFIQKLPDELLEMVVTQLDKRSQLKLSRVNKHFHILTLPHVYKRPVIRSIEYIPLVKSVMLTYHLQCESLDIDAVLENQVDIDSVSMIINSQKGLQHLSVSIDKTNLNSPESLFNSIRNSSRLRSLSLFYEEEEEFNLLSGLINNLPPSLKLLNLSSGWYSVWNSLLSTKVEHLRLRIWNEDDNPIRPYHLQRFNSLINANDTINKIEIETINKYLCGFYQRRKYQSIAFCITGLN
ncbi:hypothetical protein E3P99_01783 [Wallemia hederae]|uniref:F-box domain-containing protein n=1 Tax=Wallemia hederae TaxID=1540922 RepID=A0A4T0FPC7_9BASI|nr:hypothetical protein E3P99_01783 [Wallemia hederae]